LKSTKNVTKVKFSVSVICEPPLWISVKDNYFDRKSV